MTRLALAWTFARRELRGGLRSFRVFLACLTLGVAGVAGIGSVVAAIEAGLDARGQSLLGGDVAVELTYRVATGAERAAFEQMGDVSEIFDFRGMARTAPTEGRPESALVQAKAVDAAYPLYGELTLEPAQPLAQALAPNAAGVPGVVVEPALATRLGVEVGDPLRFGNATFELRGLILNEPDRAVSGINFGPRLIVSSAALPETGLIQPGTLFETDYRIRTAPEADLALLKEATTAGFADAGWRWRDRSNGAPGVARFVQRIGAFLTLVGLAALAVGGVGVGASVRAYLDRKTETIATLKTIGADGATIVTTYLLQIGVLAALGVGLGVLLGAGLPLIFAPMLAEALPVPADFGLYPAPLAEAALYGGLAALLFALWPLARARDVPAAGLFRDLVAPERTLPRPIYVLAVIATALALAGAAIVLTDPWYLAAAFVGGVAAALVVLATAALAVGWVARRLARTRLGRGRLPLRLALSAVGGPSGETRGAVLALGLGLTVLTAIGLIDASLRSLVRDQLPDRAPAYFFLDILNDDLESFRAEAEALPGVSALETAPMLRGVITKVNGIPSAEWAERPEVLDDGKWVLRGDRGVTYAAAQPDGAEITAGDWWPRDYAGPPLMSFSATHGAELGLSLGDTLTVNVLGREITATIANFRRVEFRDMGINFLMMFDPGTLQGAPHVHIATLYGDEPRPGAYLRSMAEGYPAVSAVRVEEAIETFADALRDIALAARVGALATLATGLVVLIGATAAAQRRQIYDAAILKTLGATRGAILTGMGLRAALLGLAAGLVALGAGALAAWSVMTFVMDAAFAFDATTAASVIIGGVAATILAGAAFAYAPLAARPARVLRARE